MNDERMEQLLAELRNDQPPAAEAAAARDAVWQALSGNPVCAGFHRDFAAYAAGTLSAARRLLVDDHLSRCPACRRALLEDSGAEPKAAVVEMKPRAPRTRPWMKWAAAAAVAAVSLYAGRDPIDRAMAPSGPRATVEAASGGVFRLTQGALRTGDTLGEGEVIRTGAGAHAVLRMADGSRVEMNQRSEVYIQAAWSGATIHLDRGDVLVEAAKQRRGRLRVVTRDSIASVKGTIFAVSADAAGSVVSVVEGAVAVEQPGVERVLAPGENSATNRALAKMDVKQAVAWSEQSEKYFALLATLTRLEKDIANLPSPALRTEAQLLRYLPAGARVYVAFPNLNGTIGQAVTLFEQRARENATLNEWWSSTQGQEIKRAIERLQGVTPLLGSEIAVVHMAEPDLTFLLAPVQTGRQDAVRAAMQQLTAGRELTYRVTPELLIAAESATDLDQIAARLGTGANSPFAAQIRSRYAKGAGWLAALDAASIIASEGPDMATRILGVGNMQAAIFEQRSAGSADDLDATFTFNGARTGVASWLAPPGSAGSTEYVSAETQMAISASTRDPRQAFEELLRMAGQSELEDLQKFETETGISVRADIAGALGTDFTVSLERVTVPTPGWVIAAEVLQPSALDSAVRRLVDAANRRIQPGSTETPIVFNEETVNGRTWRSIRTPLAAMTMHWTYDRGYLIASGDRGTALRAISVRDTGSSLPRSAAFRQAVPEGNLHHSAYIWVNVNGALADAAQLLNSDTLRSLVGSRTPVLVVLDGEMEQIHAASRTRLTSMVLDLLMTTAVVPGLQGAQ